MIGSMEAALLTRLPDSAAEIVQAVLGTDRRVLLSGQAGIGKSTLVGALAGVLAGAGRGCWCIDADPGSPSFGVPGAACLGRWRHGRWEVAALEALATLDAGRFRLPLILAVERLARQAPAGTLLVDSPGVVRGVGGAELLAGMVDAADIEAVVALTREDRSLHLEQELLALSADVYVVPAAAGARRPGKAARARGRTRQWDDYLEGTPQRILDLENLPLLGTPPPLDVPGAWRGRQIALLDGHDTLTMGECVDLDGYSLTCRLASPVRTPTALLVRDAQRLADGRLGTAEAYTAEPLAYLPAPEMAPTLAEAKGGPRVVTRVGMVDVSLVNGVFGDPLLYVRLRHQRRSVLFDLGEGSRLSARVAHQVSDVFISHCHIDHIGGFLWLLRSRIGEFPTCRLYGPPGLAGNIAGLARGILWDRVGEHGPRFQVTELHGERAKRYMVQAGRPEPAALGERPAPGGLLRQEPGFRVRAATLAHSSPVLAFALEPARQPNVRKDRLAARGLAPGPWLGELKRRAQAEELDALIELPDGATERVGRLAAELLLVGAGRKLVYATDLADTPGNRASLSALARGAHTFFCEASFLEADARQAARTTHLTTRACGEIAEAAGVARLVPFHFSRRYETDPAAIYEEIAEYCSRVVTPTSMQVFSRTS